MKRGGDSPFDLNRWDRCGETPVDDHKIPVAPFRGCVKKDYTDRFSKPISQDASKQSSPPAEHLHPLRRIPIPRPRAVPAPVQRHRSARRRRRRGDLHPLQAFHGPSAMERLRRRHRLPIRQPCPRQLPRQRRLRRLAATRPGRAGDVRGLDRDHAARARGAELLV